MQENGSRKLYISKADRPLIGLSVSAAPLPEAVNLFHRPSPAAAVPTPTHRTVWTVLKVAHCSSWACNDETHLPA